MRRGSLVSGGVVAIAVLVAASARGDGPAPWRVRKRLDGHGGPVSRVAFSPDGKLLAAGLDDGSVRVFDLASREQRSKLAGHKKGVYSVAFSPDGKTLASASLEGTVALWTVESGALRATLGRANDWGVPP